MANPPPLRAFIVCKHRPYGNEGHTLPCVVDLFLAKRVFWPVMMQLYFRTRITPLATARACALAGFIYFPVDQIRFMRSPVDVVLFPLVLIVPVFVFGAVKRMAKMHERLGTGENPTLDDISELYDQRRIRIIVTLFMLYALVTLQFRDAFGMGVFAVWPTFAACIGGPPTKKLHERASEASRRLRALLESLGPKPALRGAPA